MKCSIMLHFIWVFTVCTYFGFPEYIGLIDCDSKYPMVFYAQNSVFYLFIYLFILLKLEELMASMILLRLEKILTLIY